MKRRTFLAASACGFAGCVVQGAESLAGMPPPVDQAIRQSSQNAPLRMIFRGSKGDECRAWQRQFTDRLRSLLGPHRPPRKWRTTVERTVNLKDHRREELLLRADGHPDLPVYVLTPRGNNKQRRAAVVALHGHGEFGYDPVVGRETSADISAAIKRANYDYGRQLVRRGYVVAAPCLTPFGRRLGPRKAYGNQDPCAVTFVRMQLLGRVLMAENLRDALWCVELLSQRREVDAKRLGCVGLSYGGRMTMLTTALEPRIRVAVISGALNLMQERIQHRYSCGAQVIPGLLQYGDVPEIGSLIAPRPAVWEVGSRDGLMVPKWVEIGRRRMQRAYDALGAGENLIIDRFEGGHRWNGVVANKVLDRVLRR